MTSLSQVKREVEIVKRALGVRDSDEIKRTKEINDLLRRMESLAPPDSPIWREAAKAVAKKYAKGLIK